MLEQKVCRAADGVAMERSQSAAVPAAFPGTRVSPASRRVMFALPWTALTLDSGGFLECLVVSGLLLQEEPPPPASEARKQFVYLTSASNFRPLR